MVCVGHRNVEIRKQQERFFFFLLSHLRTMQAAAARQRRFHGSFGDKLGPENTSPAAQGLCVHVGRLVLERWQNIPNQTQITSQPLDIKHKAC